MLPDVEIKQKKCLKRKGICDNKNISSYLACVKRVEKEFKALREINLQILNLSNLENQRKRIEYLLLSKKMLFETVPMKFLCF